MFYKQVFINSQAKNKKDNNFIQYVPKRNINITDPLLGTHQKDGRLTAVDKLQKIGTSKRIYLLCLCDCGNWTIVRRDAFTSQTTNGGAFSCGCLNNEKRKIILNDPEIQQRKIDNRINKLIEDNVIPQKGENKFGWEILESEMRVYNGRRRRYIKGICPQCKLPSQWIRYDGIASGEVIGCGCKAGGNDSMAVKKIIELLEQNNIPYVREKTFESCINPHTNKKLRFDFFINNEYLLEYDGEQHFKKSFGYSNEDFFQLQKRDQIKNLYCKENNIPLLRIPYSKNHLNLSLEDILLETSSFKIE